MPAGQLFEVVRYRTEDGTQKLVTIAEVRKYGRRGNASLSGHMAVTGTSEAVAGESLDSTPEKLLPAFLRQQPARATPGRFHVSEDTILSAAVDEAGDGGL